MVGILYNVRSLHNVGSIFRTADGVGIEKLYLCGITPEPVDAFGRPRRQLIKVSLGSEKYVAWERVGSTSSPQATVKLIDQLKRDKYAVFAVEQDKRSVPYYKARGKRAGRVALIVGSEVRGLPPSILSAASRVVEIPMRGEKESLNVSVAFGVVAYHFVFGYA